MIRTGWVIYYEDISYGTYLPVDTKVYLNKETAYEVIKDLVSKGKWRKEDLILYSFEVIEDDQSIDDFYNQIEQENPQYKADLTEVINEVMGELKNPTSSNNPYVDSNGFITDTKKYLRHISNETLDKNWLSKISICGGD